MSIANQCRNGNTSSEISTMAMECIGHSRASLLTRGTLNRLAGIAYATHAAPSQEQATFVRSVLEQLEGRRAVA